LDKNGKLLNQDIPGAHLVLRSFQKMVQDFFRDRPKYLESQSGIKNIGLNNDSQITPPVDNETGKNILHLIYLNHSFKSSEEDIFVIVTDHTCSEFSASMKDSKIIYENNKEKNITLDKNITNKNLIVINKHSVKYKNLKIALSNAQSNYSDFIEFGHDCQTGISRLEKDAGPPDLVYTYLETLKDMVVYFRKYPERFTDENSLIKYLTICGCDCVSETDELMSNTENSEERKFLDSIEQKSTTPFRLHLRPATQPENAPPSGKSYGTVRIYFKWDLINKPVLIGWIGPHPKDHRKKA
jgi:hypothetical protein